MSVYTSVNIEELKIWLQDYALDDLTDYQGIKSGITNTNYFLMTAHDRFVLTLFEKNTIEDLPYFVDHFLPYLSIEPCNDALIHLIG